MLGRCSFPELHLQLRFLLQKSIYCSQIIEETPHITQSHTGVSTGDEVRRKLSYELHGEERVRQVRGREASSMGAGLTSVPYFPPWTDWGSWKMRQSMGKGR